MSDNIPKIYKSGKLRADKIQYKDGVGCCIWYPMEYKDDNGEVKEDSGICFDFSFSDIHDMKALLNILIDATPHIYNDPIEEENQKEDWVIPDADIVDEETPLDEFLKDTEEGDEENNDK